MLSVEIIEQLRQEEERRRREAEAPVLRVPVDGPEMPTVLEERASDDQPIRTGVTVVEVSRDDLEQFRIQSW